MNVSTVLPWELNPALKRERLVTLAKLVADTRNKVFADADRDAGDTNWGLACRAHERLGHALTRLAEGGKHPWLTVSREGLYLMTRIEDVPVRAYRGSPEKPSARSLDALRAELTRHPPKQIAFSFMEAADQDGPWYWLLALETDADGRVTRATYLQANDAHETRNAWECPLDEPVEAPEPRRRTPPRSATRAVAAPAVAAPEPEAAIELPVVAVGNDTPATLHAV